MFAPALTHCDIFTVCNVKLNRNAAANNSLMEKVIPSTFQCTSAHDKGTA